MSEWHERIIHFYGQYIQHDDVQIIGNRKALEALRDELDKVLITGYRRILVMANDGEGYDVIITLQENLDDSPPHYESYKPYKHGKRGH